HRDPYHSIVFFLFTPPTATYVHTLSLHDALPICTPLLTISAASKQGLKELLYEVKSQVNAVYEAEAAEEPDEDEGVPLYTIQPRSEEHTSELQSREKLVCRLLPEKKQKTATTRSR